ncbi:MAG: histidinol-phosphate transaminase [Oscillospiraceae bacterium]|nr:histidinol-phosphate transaminase [Oscillospiraceae bacterium]
MSRFFTGRLSALTPYVPGEQPQDRKYLKLNTNESPFPPSPGVTRAAEEEAGKAQLYSDPESAVLRRALGARYGLEPERIVVSNGSDEVLNFAFMAFGDEKAPLVFPDITYGFYPVFAELNRIPYRTIPLDGDFRIRPEDYYDSGCNVVLANPNAPTGLALEPDQVEDILKRNREHVVILDEAYVDFGGESALPLLGKYDNLLIVQTFSKSRSMAGARLGFAMGSEAIIGDLKTIQYSTNPYNVNRMTAAAGTAALREQAYYDDCCRRIMENRVWTKERLEELGFSVLPSRTNFLFARWDRMGGEELYLALKERGILIRHFGLERIRDYNRITIGTREQMETFIAGVRECLEDKA